MNNLKEFIGFDGFEIVIDKNGKKQFKKLPLDWGNVRKTILIKKGVELQQAIHTGKLNKLTVFDFDELSSYIAFTEKYPFLNDTLTVKTRRGFHLYFEYSEQFKSGSDLFQNYSNIDIINDNKFITAPNTFYFDENGKKIVYNIIEDKDIMKLSNEQIANILEDLKKPTSKESFNISEKKNKINKTEIEEIIEIIDLQYINNYTDWTQIVWSLASVNEYDLSVDISKKSDKFDYETHDKIYKKNNNKIGIGTLFNYAKMSDEIKFLEIKKKYKIINSDLYISKVPLTEKYEGTDYDLATLYLKLNNENVIYFDNNIYFYKDIFWKKDEKLTYLMYDIRCKIAGWFNAKYNFYMTKAFDPLEPENKQMLETANYANKIIQSINKIGKQKSVLEQVENILRAENEHEENIFDINKPNVFCFKNRFFNVIEKKEVEIKKTDYITIHSGYNYVEPTQEEINLIESIFIEIMPDPDKLKCLLSILKTCLTSNPALKFILFNGSGCNGKGWVLEFLRQLLGENKYFVSANKTMLTCKSSKGTSEDMVALNKKRLSLYSEPEHNESLNSGIIKCITDTPTVQARGLFKELETVYLFSTFIMECNQKPKIKGRADEALLRRLIDFEFPISFVDTKDEIIDETFKLKKPEYKDIHFIAKHRYAFFNYVMENAPNKLFIPESVANKSREYVMDCDDLINWFNEHYEITKNKNDIVTCKDLYADFKESNVYREMSKEDRRMQATKTNFTDGIAKNIKLRGCYKDDYRPIIDGKQTRIRCCLVGVKELECEDEEEELTKYL